MDRDNFLHLYRIRELFDCHFAKCIRETSKFAVIVHKDNDSEVCCSV